VLDPGVDRDAVRSRHRVGPQQRIGPQQGVGPQFPSRCAAPGSRSSEIANRCMPALVTLSLIKIEFFDGLERREECKDFRQWRWARREHLPDDRNFKRALNAFRSVSGGGRGCRRVGRGGRRDRANGFRVPMSTDSRALGAHGGGAVHAGEQGRMGPHVAWPTGWTGVLGRRGTPTSRVRPISRAPGADTAGQPDSFRWGVRAQQQVPRAGDAGQGGAGEVGTPGPQIRSSPGQPNAAPR